jgi:gas vesicle protein
MSERRYYSNEAEQQARRERTAAAMTFMVLGLGIGVILALLFAPDSGDKTRKELMESAGHTFDDSREATNRALERLQRNFDDLRERVEERIKELS